MGATWNPFCCLSYNFSIYNRGEVMLLEDFTRRHNRNKRFIWIAVVIKFIIAITIITAIGFSVVYVIKEVSERGLKSIVEEVWEGPDNK